MKTIRILKPGIFCLFSLWIFIASYASAQTTEISSEFLMTLHIPTDLPQEIDSALIIYNFQEGGWVKGPKISGKLMAPGADWVQVLPGGSTRLDVRSTIKTDDGALIFLQYEGIFSASEEAFEQMTQGDVLTSEDIYVIITPTFRTSQEKYAWLNHVQCIGKVVEVKDGEEGYIKYDIFAVR